MKLDEGWFITWLQRRDFGNEESGNQGPFSTITTNTRRAQNGITSGARENRGHQGGSNQLECWSGCRQVAERPRLLVGFESRCDLSKLEGLTTKEPGIV